MILNKIKYFTVPIDNNKQSVPVNSYMSGKIHLNQLNKLCLHNLINNFSVKPIESKIYVPPSERTVGMEPHKYTGSSIPSRSFKMLQAMTGQNNGKILDLIILNTNHILMKSGDQICDTI